MPLPTIGQIPVDFATLRANYPTYTALPRHISAYMDELNRNNPPGAPRNTPCCFQVSEAFNLAGAEHKIPPRSYRRANTHLGQNYYLGAVDELEVYLTNRYGSGEVVFSGDGHHADIAATKARMAGRPGVITFRDGGYGLHTELWTGSSIVQAHGAPGSNGANMSERGIFSVRRILFWSCSGEDGRDPLPAWVVGWWQVNVTGQPYYYYFSDQYVVFYTTTMPTNILSQPVRGAMMQGSVTLAEGRPGVVITWPPSPDGEVTESYFQAGNDPRVMQGRINNLLPAEAIKMDLPEPPRPRRRPHR